MSTREPSLAEQAQRDWDALRGVGELFPETPLEESSRQLEADGSWPEDLTGTPIVVAGPDSVSLTAAANGHDLALVITAEVEQARAVLSGLGRADVTVSGPDGVSAALAAVAAGTDRPIRWVGVGQPDELVSVLDSGSDLVQRLRVTQLQVGSGAGALLRAVADGRLALDLVSQNPADGESGPAVAVAAARLLPFVDFRRIPAGADATDHFQPAEDGVPLWWGVSNEPDALRRWLTPLLGPGGDSPPRSEA